MKEICDFMIASMPNTKLTDSGAHSPPNRNRIESPLSVQSRVRPRDHCLCSICGCLALALSMAFISPGMVASIANTSKPLMIEPANALPKMQARPCRLVATRAAMPRINPEMMSSIEVRPRTIIAIRLPRTAGCKKIPMPNETSGATKLNVAACLGNELTGGAGIIGGDVRIGGGVDVSIRVVGSRTRRSALKPIMGDVWQDQSRHVDYRSWPRLYGQITHNGKLPPMKESQRRRQPGWFADLCGKNVRSSSRKLFILNRGFLQPI